MAAARMSGLSPMEYIVNIRDIEFALVKLGGLAAVRKIQDYVLQFNCAGSVPQNYKNERTFRQTIQRKIEDYCPEAEGFSSKKRHAKFARVGPGVYKHVVLGDPEFRLAEEVVVVGELIEGALKTVTVNSHERSAEARIKCIAHHGCVCKCCGFDFERTYGTLGKGFIHVHHVMPLSVKKGPYVVDPVADLVPLCANCHAMVHRAGFILTVDELKALLAETQSANAEPTQERPDGTNDARAPRRDSQC